MPYAWVCCRFRRSRASQPCCSGASFILLKCFSITYEGCHGHARRSAPGRAALDCCPEDGPTRELSQEIVHPQKALWGRAPGEVLPHLLDHDLGGAVADVGPARRIQPDPGVGALDEQGYLVRVRGGAISKQTDAPNGGSS